MTWAAGVRASRRSVGGAVDDDYDEYEGYETYDPREHALPASDVVRGVTLRAETADGRKVLWRQPLVDPSRKMAGTWSGDRSLICEVLSLLHLDPDEDPESLHSLALALIWAAGVDGKNDSITLLLAHYHPREELERGRREREWRDEHGWDDPPEVGV